MSSLGNKIKYFRERAGLTQFDLELALRTSPGSISRIEKGKTNPTKETLYKIHEVLDLNAFETDYLTGTLALPATQSEVNAAINEIKSYLQRPGVLAYLVDDRHRLVAISDEFYKLLGITDVRAQMLYMTSINVALIDPKYEIRQVIEPSTYRETLKYNLVKYYYEAAFMIDDPTQQETNIAIMKDPVARAVWQEVLSDPPQSPNTLEARTVFFQLNGQTIKMVYSAEFLSKNRRFVLVEYGQGNGM